MTNSFQVDLRGMVDLVGRHLYSGPRVFVRELLQNAVDAVSARQLTDDFDPKVQFRLFTDDLGQGLDATDNGIGLTVDQATELLSTIGRSSKRDEEFGLGRSEFIGQFGIGMLAAFMVSETIEVISKSASAEVGVRWFGRDDGTFTVEGVDASDPDIATLGVGTRVRLRPRPDAEHWFAHDVITGLMRDYGELLPVDVSVLTPVGDTELPQRISAPELPWRRTYAHEAERHAALSAYCERTFGFTPLGMIDLAVPLAGVSGVAFILPTAVAPGAGRHRVYVKQMLLGERVDAILPPWAFFLRAVINADGLNPTASREQLHTDGVLEATSEAVADQLRRWITDTLTQPTQLAADVVKTHHLAIRSLAVTEPDLLEFAAEVLPYETTRGPMTLADIKEHDGEIVFAATTDDYRRVSAVARAQGLTLVNAGYVYDADLLAQLAGRDGWQVRELTSGDLVQVLNPVAPERELEVLDAIEAATDALSEHRCDVLIRSFEPDHVPAVLLRDREGEHQRRLEAERETAGDLWGDVLAAFSRPTAERQLVFNDASSVTRRLLNNPNDPVFAAGVKALHMTAVMLAGEGLNTNEIDEFSTALDALLRAGLRPEEG